MFGSEPVNSSSEYRGVAGEEEEEKYAPHIKGKSI